MEKEKKQIQRKLNTFKYTNKKEYRNIKLYEIITDLEQIKELIEIVNENAKELYNLTECWEKNSTLDYEMNDWKELNKIRGKILRYRNIIKTIIDNVIEKENKKWKKQKFYYS